MAGKTGLGAPPTLRGQPGGPAPGDGDGGDGHVFCSSGRRGPEALYGINGLNGMGA